MREARGEDTKEIIFDLRYVYFGLVHKKGHVRSSVCLSLGPHLQLKNCWTDFYKN
jgi:hypothetical protein